MSLLKVRIDHETLRDNVTTSITVEIEGDSASYNTMTDLAVDAIVTLTSGERQKPLPLEFPKGIEVTRDA